MMNGSGVESERDLQLSALVDGEVEASTIGQVCERWRNEVSVRRRWHDYQLIGDVLRSEDLASSAAHDEEFLVALRSRLAAEPVVLAPSHSAAAPPAVPARSRPGGRFRLATFGAIAAGFVVVVAGALTFTGLPVMNNPQDKAGSQTLAQSKPPAVVAASEAQSDPVNELQPTVASGKLVRDARLDRYFSAHQQWSSGAMLGGHAAFMRQNLNDASNR